MSEGHQFKTPRISIRGSVRPSFRPSVHPQGRYAISKTAENETIRGGLPSKTFLTGTTATSATIITASTTIQSTSQRLAN